MIGWISKKKKSAFTLMELLVSVLIFAVIMILISGVLTRVVSSSRVNAEDYEIQQSLAYAGEYIKEKISGAQFNTSQAENICTSILPQSYFYSDSADILVFMDRNRLCRYFQLDSSTSRLMFCSSLSGDWEDVECFYLTSENFSLENLTFQINLSGDRFLGVTYSLTALSESGASQVLQGGVAVPYLENYYVPIESN